MYDYLIVGSGLFGSTFAYRAKQAGKKCLVIESGSTWEETCIARRGMVFMCINMEHISSTLPTRKCGSSSTRLLSSTDIPTRQLQTMRDSFLICRSI